MERGELVLFLTKVSEIQAARMFPSHVPLYILWIVEHFRNNILKVIHSGANI